MSIRCSVLGHDTDEVTEEIEAEEGEVSVVKVIEKCARCGEEETVKESKRVSIAEAESEYQSALGPQAADTPEPAIADGGRADEEINNADDDAVFIDAEENEADDDPTPTASDSPETTSNSSDTPASDTESEIDLDGDKHQEIEEDDAVLLSSSSGTNDASTNPQQTPQSSSSGASETQSNATTQTSADAESSAGNDTFDSDAFNGKIPDEDPAAEESADEGDILTAGEDAVPAATTSSSASDGTILTCDSCRFKVDAEGTPIRRGDICPHCKTGYIETA